MKTKPRAIGTAGETAVVRFLKANGFGLAERRSLKGAQDQGDITGTPGICWEIKSGNKAREAITATRSSALVTEWLAETETERRNAAADIGILVVQTPGTTDPGRWWAVLPAWALTGLAVDTVPASSLCNIPVRLLLADLVTLLRAAGYGDAIPAEETA